MAGKTLSQAVMIQWPQECNVPKKLIRQMQIIPKEYNFNLAIRMHLDEVLRKKSNQITKHTTKHHE
jgi:hypothetical protein